MMAQHLMLIRQLFEFSSWGGGGEEGSMPVFNRQTFLDPRM